MKSRGASARNALSLVALGHLAIGCAGSDGGQADTATTDEALDTTALVAITAHPFRDLCALDTTPGHLRCHAKVRTTSTGGIQSTAAPAGLAPADLTAAYKVPATVSTATIAIVDAQDDPEAEADLAVYREQFGLPACTTANGCFTKVNEQGKATPLPTADQGWAGEIMLDIEMASAVCPTCKILLVEADQPTTKDLGTAVNTAVSLGATVVSNSYGGAEEATDENADNAYYHHKGVAIFASSGDNGYGVSYPASGRWVIGVSGTSLARSASSRGWAEQAWSGAGSGCSEFTVKPSWQNDTDCKTKMVSDLSAVADPDTGVAVYDKYGSGGWAVYGGTSVASPLVASIFAAMGHGIVSGSYVWEHSTDYHDVTKGRNGTCVAADMYYCTSGKDYDGPTGWGTPNGDKLTRPSLPRDALDD